MAVYSVSQSQLGSGYRPGFVAVVMSAMLSGCLGGSDSQESDAVVVEDPVAYIQRPLLVSEDGELLGDDRSEPGLFRPGARLFLKDRATASASARDITSSAFSGAGKAPAVYDVRDLAVAPDGSALLFAMRAPELEDVRDEEQPTWNIWQYHLPSQQLQRVIDSDVVAESGQDIAPAYLPDGRIVFSSTRQRRSRAVLLDEGKPQYAALDEDRQGPAFVLHVMEPDGTGIEQITFNQSHDLDPAVQPDGSIIFSRWDNAGQTRNNGVNLYKVNPDGTGLTYLFGRHSHEGLAESGSLQFFRPKPVGDGRVQVQLRPWETDDFRALPVELDINQYVELSLGTDGNEGQAFEALVEGADIDADIPVQGHVGSVSPLGDGSGRYLASWSPCRLRPMEEPEPVVNCTDERIDSGDYRAAFPVYGLWLLDPDQDTRRPLVSPVEGMAFEEAVLVRAGSTPAFRPPAQYTGEAADLAEEGYGILNIRSVYDLDGVDVSPLGIANTADPALFAPDQLPARFLRIVKPVSIPDDSVRNVRRSAFGRSRGQSMREILGYVPVEPDGSARVAVPANVPFAISVVDGAGQRISARHQNWLQLAPGETVSCNGCHDPDSGVSHGRPDAAPASVWAGAPTTGLEFPNTRPELFADMGETMAQTWARINGTRRLQPDAVVEDLWTDTTDVTPAEPITLSYSDLATPVPANEACLLDWTAECRIVVHYEQHIHPLWGLERIVEVVEDGVTVEEDYTCTGCHTAEDADGLARLPDAQLDLTDGVSENGDHFSAYRELLFTDNEQELVDGALVDILIDTGEFARNEDGELILDGAGAPIPIFETIPVFASMSPSGARASDGFFSRFAEGGSHEGFLADAELKLIAEWLDVGAQYYNNPFDAPED